QPAAGGDAGIFQPTTLKSPFSNWMETDWAVAVIPIKRMTASPKRMFLQQRITNLRQRHRLQSGSTTVLAHHEQNVRVVQLRKMTNVADAADLVVRNAGNIRNRR